MVEPVELGTRANPVDAYSDRLNLALRTSDPSNPGGGEAWIRTDLDSGDRLATLRVQGVGDVPIFPTGMSGDNVIEVFRCQLPAGTGFVPLASGGAAYPQLGFQHDGSAYGYHDALSASAIPDSVVDHFEASQYEDKSATLSTFYSSILNSGLSNSQRQQTTVQEGSYALQIDSANGSGQAIGSLETDGLNRYPNRGETWRQWVRTGTSGNERVFAVFGLQDYNIDNLYHAGINRPGGDLRITKWESGSSTTLDSVSQSWSDSTWYDVEIQWGIDDSIVCTVYDAGASQVNSVSASDGTFTDGGFGWWQGIASGGDTTYHDFARVVS